jgi:sarcosine oxidase subunit alpha
MSYRLRSLGRPMDQIVGRFIDRTKPITFLFDSTEYQGFAGDTVASALLANGVVGGFRSPILGRPRGVMTDGPQEPGALVRVNAPWHDVIAPAPMVELVEGLEVESSAGVGRIAVGNTPHARMEHRYTHVDTLVIGEDGFGLIEARRAGERGDRVLILQPSGTPELEGRWQPKGDVTVMSGTTALGVYEDGYVVALERAWPVQRLWHIRARRVVLATGASELPIVFRGNDRPGVMLAGAANRYLFDYGVAVGKQVVLFTSSVDSDGFSKRYYLPGYSSMSFFLLRAPAVIVDVRPITPPHSLIPGVMEVFPDPPRPRVLAGSVVTGTAGDQQIRAVTVRGQDGQEQEIACDALLVSGGMAPNLGLWRAAGGTVRYAPSRGCFVPDKGPPWLAVVGEAAGRVPEYTAPWFVPGDDLSEHFVDFQRDQTVADIQAALDAGLRSIEHVKRATYIGTAIDQGRTSSPLTAAIVNQLLGAEPGAQGPTTARPPAVPVSFATLAGPYAGSGFDPVRLTPIQPWHVAHGAVFEDVGQWKRPRFFPHRGEEMDEAVLRECAAVRTGVGMQDASTLGKIDVVGSDAGVFLDRMYTNAMSTLGVGKIRYGLMVGVDGMAFDDGVAMRLAEDRYLVTTTTGGAARVLDRLEEWLQTEWPELRVYCTSVTEQWATIAVAGPRAREVIAAAGTDVDVSNEAFPFMTWREGTVAGIGTRLARVSFSGELAIEVNVAGTDGLRMWEALFEAGRGIGVTPYGTEAMHVLRAEKGFAIVGQETDGTVTPDDLGMSWIVNLKKGDFVGRRSLRRPALVAPGRKQLVGLLPEDPDALLPEGSQLVLEGTRSAGYVTSSYRSAALGRTFALALLAGGHDRHGATVRVPIRNATVDATVTSPVLYDPEGARRDG